MQLPSTLVPVWSTGSPLAAASPLSCLLLLIAVHMRRGAPRETLAPRLQHGHRPAIDARNALVAHTPPAPLHARGAASAGRPGEAALVGRAGVAGAGGTKGGPWKGSCLRASRSTAPIQGLRSRRPGGRGACLQAGVGRLRAMSPPPGWHLATFLHVTSLSHIPSLRSVGIGQTRTGLSDLARCTRARRTGRWTPAQARAVLEGLLQTLRCCGRCSPAPSRVRAPRRSARCARCKHSKAPPASPALAVVPPDP
jgi:hypothetical protein